MPFSAEPANQPTDPIREEIEEVAILSGKTSKKRLRNAAGWRNKKAAINRARGEEYITQKGITIPAKTANHDELCDCNKRCSDQFSIEVRNTWICYWTQ